MNLHYKYVGIMTKPNTGRIEIYLRIGVPGGNLAGGDFVPSGKYDIRYGWFELNVFRNQPVDMSEIVFVRKSTYIFRLIVHPNGGNAMWIVCDTCHADYPFSWTMQKLTPCANCAVHRQSGWQVKLWKWKWERLHKTYKERTDGDL